ncbi:MAG: hypothetical protein HGGPFJEG_01894 [Ignavibacteria bacterium]|nr:hypothetical protein [Ignavibacteria bacterium]
MNQQYLINLKNPEWSAKRKVVLKRDSYKCRNCGSPNNLVVHHRQYHKQPDSGKYCNSWDYKLKYLITLCSQCHINGHLKFKIKHL